MVLNPATSRRDVIRAIVADALEIVAYWLIAGALLVSPSHPMIAMECSAMGGTLKVVSRWVAPHRLTKQP